jgi:hypothetical protein
MAKALVGTNARKRTPAANCKRRKDRHILSSLRAMRSDFSRPEPDREIEYAAFRASRVMSSLVSKRETLFPQKREPRYQATDEDVPK